MITTTILMHLTIPHSLIEGLETPQRIKEHLRSYDIWPAHVQAERWRMATAVRGYEVELEVAVTLITAETGAP